MDVCVVGAGYTGLWTAYHLLRADRDRSVLVVEAEHAGSGASGRNGGWCSALFPAGLAALARRHDPDAASAMRAAMRSAVDEVGAAVAEEGIACDWVKGGTVVLARTPAQWRRARAEAAETGPDRVVLLSAAEDRSLVGAAGVQGATVVRTARGCSRCGWRAGWPGRWRPGAGGWRNAPGPSSWRRGGC